MWRAQIERIIGKNEYLEPPQQAQIPEVKQQKGNTDKPNYQEQSKNQQKIEPIELITIKEALKYATKNTREYAKIILVKARIMSTRGYTEKALKYVNKQQEYLESLNQNKVPDLLIMECHYIKGIIYFQKENIQTSIQQFQLAIQVYEARGDLTHPDCQLIYFKLSKCYARLGKISQASSMYERAAILYEKSITLISLDEFKQKDFEKEIRKQNKREIKRQNRKKLENGKGQVKENENSNLNQNKNQIQNKNQNQDEYKDESEYEDDPDYDCDYVDPNVREKDKRKKECIISRSYEKYFHDPRQVKQQMEDSENILMYNHCLHLKDQGQYKQSMQFSLELLQNYKYQLAPNPQFVYQLLEYHYNSLNLKIKITKS